MHEEENKYIKAKSIEAKLKFNNSFGNWEKFPNNSFFEVIPYVGVNWSTVA